MKRFRIWGSITVAAIFAMALLSPSLALGEGTLLCEADEEGECSSPLSHIHYEADDLVVLTSAMDYKCDGLLLASIGELGSPQVLKGKFTYTSCNNNCERIEENGPATLYFLKTGHESAKGTGESLVHVLCGGFINCSYTLKNVTGNIIGPLLSSESNGEIRFEKSALSHEPGFLCPEEAYLHATFVPLSETYISS